MKNTKKGFTLVELSLSLIFISFMLLTLAFLLSYIGGLYEKGITIKDVSATGRELVDDFSRSISASTSRYTLSYCGNYVSGGADYWAGVTSTSYERCYDNFAHLYIYQQRTGVVRVKGVEKRVPVHGIFCTGSYSYIWNTGYALNREDYEPVGRESYALKLQSDGELFEDFRLLKFPDPDRQLCQAATSTSDYAPNAIETLNFNVIPSVQFEELLDGSENDLVLYDMTIFKPTQHDLTYQSFYSGTFTIATLRGNVDITGNGDYCAVPVGESMDAYGGTEFNYCAINKFNFSMRSTGQTIKQ